MRKLLLLYFVFLFGKISAQSTSPNLASNLLHDTCLNKKFSIVFYIIPDSTFYPIVQANVNAIKNLTLTPFINKLNEIFKPICVSFENCSTKIILNHPYSQWTQTVVDPIVTSNWYTDKTINFYLPVSVTTTMVNEISAYAYPPPINNFTNAKDVIVAPLGSLVTPNLVNIDGTSAIHAVGHFFGLPNTFSELGSNATPGPPPGAISQEFYDRTNCSTNGDRFCDTEADPYPLQYSTAMPIPHCYFKKVPGQLDGKGKYYIPPVDNFMSEYGCRCKFTQEQYNFMARVILKQRLYLH